MTSMSKKQSTNEQPEPKVVKRLLYRPTTGETVDAADAVMSKQVNTEVEEGDVES